MKGTVAIAAALILAVGGVADPVAASPQRTHTPASHSAYSYIHHPVSTSIPAAQFEFDRGLTMIFAYQDEEAELSFREAARLDPTLAMAWWGIGMSMGPDINREPDRKKTASAAEALRRARLLAERRATLSERDYIEALAHRYADGPDFDFDALASDYRDAMRSLMRKYPADPDAAALFAEAAMDLRPWLLWDAAGNPEPGTQELVDVIEGALTQHPEHMGLLHFYIHAVEASSDPGRALSVAHRLAALPMEPAASHLVHMPAHIYMRTGQWNAAVGANLQATHHALDYRISSNPSAQRACSHCADFLSYAYMMEGNEAGARHSSDDYAKMTGDPSNSLAVLIRFGRWSEVLEVADPGADSKSGHRNTHLIRGFWEFARGLAFVATQRTDEAQRALDALLAEAKLSPPAADLTGPPDVEHIQDKVAQTSDAMALQIGASILGSRLAEARGDLPKALELMRAAVRYQDDIPYSEPPAWYYPVRESLGALLLRSGSPGEAEEVFGRDLRRSPENPRSLLGLSVALDAQGRTSEAATVRARFETAWQYADVKLNAPDL